MGGKAPGQIVKVRIPEWPQDSAGNRDRREKAANAGVKLCWRAPNGRRSADHFEGLLISGAQTREPTRSCAMRINASLVTAAYRQTLLPADNMPT